MPLSFTVLIWVWANQEQPTHTPTSTVDTHAYVLHCVESGNIGKLAHFYYQPAHLIRAHLCKLYMCCVKSRDEKQVEPSKISLPMKKHSEPLVSSGSIVWLVTWTTTRFNPDGTKRVAREINTMQSFIIFWLFCKLYLKMVEREGVSRGPAYWYHTNPLPNVSVTRWRCGILRFEEKFPAKCQPNKVSYIIPPF